MRGGGEAATARAASMRPASSALRLIDTEPRTRRRGRTPCGETVEQAVGVVVDEQAVRIVALYEPRFDPTGQEQPEAVPVAADVERADRLRVDAELCPREHLEQLLERAEPAGQREEAVRQPGHQ